MHVTTDADTAGEFSINGERSDARGVGARFIAPWGGVGPTLESVHRIRQQYLMQVMQTVQILLQTRCICLTSDQNTLKLKLRTVNYPELPNYICYK